MKINLPNFKRPFCKKCGVDVKGFDVIHDGVSGVVTIKASCHRTSGKARITEERLWKMIEAMRQGGSRSIGIGSFLCEVEIDEEDKKLALKGGELHK